MILLRKNASPQELRDYRPISLMHSFSKLFAKCLTRRLAPRLHEIVAPNQSAFVKGRSIHDNFRSVQLACRWLHSKHSPWVLLKIDIAKAFDSVAWPFLLKVLQHIGFSLHWTNWISILLSTANTKVLVNGRAGRRIAHARGLRQGDPLSPMLFVIVMEVLNSLIRAADQRWLLTMLPGSSIVHMASLYADDLVVLVAPTENDLRCIKEILDLFAGASGLVTNIDKCVVAPIRCTDEMLAVVQQIFPCTVTSFPCRYLGAPLSLSRLRRADEQALIDAVASRIPTWKSGLLTAAGRTLLTKVTLSAIPVHISIAVSLSQWAIDQIDRRRRAFLWAGTQSVSGGKCKVAWTTVCRPTSLGGLGVLDLRFFGYAFRLRWEWLKRTEPGHCWVRLPDHAQKQVAAMRDVSLSVILGDGASCLFWMDNWAIVGPLCHFAPALFATISCSGRRRSVKDALHGNRWVRDIAGALTTQVLCEYLALWEFLREVALDDTQTDCFVWRWSAGGKYSASSTYRAFFLGSSSLLGAKELWRVRVPPKLKFFFWLALHGRLWTADRRKRHGLQDSDSCALCDQDVESMDHLVKGCVFSRELWFLLLSPLGLLELMPAPTCQSANPALGFGGCNRDVV